MASNSAPTLESLEAVCYRVPTDYPEADGTITWDHTDVIVVHVHAGGATGLGYSYASAGSLPIIREVLWPAIRSASAMAIPHCWASMRRKVRNIGAPGVAAMAISAVDNALWDLKARLLNMALVDLLGSVRDNILGYGSGGFTSYSPQKLASQLEHWAAQGFRFVKMKVGSDPAKDRERVKAARHAIGDAPQLFVDANGAYCVKSAIGFADAFAECGVTWFEEPVSSDDLAGLRFVREHVPAPMNVAAGEYGFDAQYFCRLLQAGAVDVLQADITRCGGVTGFLQAAALAEAFMIPLSAHCAPALHTPVCCAVQRAVHIEYFHDHSRIENLFFDGAPQPRDGMLQPDRTRPGFGLELRNADADPFRQ